MAETILFGLVDKMIWRLGSSVVQQLGIVWNVTDELERIQSTVSTIKAVVMDAEEQGATNHAVKHWLEKLKDAVDDADDLLDDFSTEALRREIMASEKKKSNKVRNFFSKSNPVMHDFKMGHRIKNIRKRLDDIAEDRLKFNFTGLTTVTRFKNREREQTYSFVREEEVIGREEEKADLIKLLRDTTVEDNVSVIPIVGIGGLGKTTLAQLVYNDASIQNHFELKIWVCVSDDDFDVKNIVGKIVEDNKNREMEKLQQDLRAKIMGKRYLLVLDDVWDKNLSRERWLKLKTLLLDGAKGTKVIVTSRSEKVAKITGTAATFHLQGLDERKSWILFSSLAFAKGEEPKNQEDLVAIGKEIVKKCSGVPLAIRSIGSLLYGKSSENDWLYFKENDLAKMNPEDNNIIPILQLSYDHLPYDLKNCFAYCSIFPKDYIIEKNTLIQLWMAQGFIQPLDEKRSLEDVGDEYFMNLYWRSFFQDVKRDMYGDISECKMHDLIHDLAQYVAGNECSDIAGQERKNISNRTRHVSLGHELPSRWKVPTWFVKANKLRTFLLCTSYFVDWEVLDCDSLISSFKFLRTLDLHSSWNKALPNSIGLLKHLRYLDLSCNDEIEILPTSITSLHNLQTLKLSFCGNLRELPTDIFAKLISLRHLGLNGCDKLTYVPYGLGRLTSFRTLTTFVVADVNNVSSSCGLSELSQLNNLSGSLEVRGLQYNTEEGKVAELQDKRLLNSLTLNWDRSFDTPPNAVVAAKDELLFEGLQPHPKIKSLIVRWFGGVKFSAWLSSLSNLVHIGITYCSELQHLPPLHQLPHLEHLELSNLRSLEYVDSRDNESDWSSSSSSSSSPLFFPSLKRLELRDMDKLRGWWKWSEVTSEAEYQQMFLPWFPCLSGLWVANCPNLTSLPLYPYIEWLNCLRISVKMLRQLLKPPATTTTADGSQIYTILQSSSSSSSHHSPFSRLRYLFINGMEDLENFPDELLPSLTTLQDLFINDCNNLASLPEWIGKLPLQQIYISRCCKLTSLPEGMRDIKSLRTLWITGSSSQIKERCKKEEGEDWPKIAHVQYCSIN
ncbi:Disease resistance protein [Quillaja saponaria]|uniref:Disease resistance protein n=1 Tax=Quillaja saponaria TaxID=32244 RepID=A0AAD7VND9_QUISA|nr:Disease resistance protein [Quillaja saponaria]